MGWVGNNLHGYRKQTLTDALQKSGKHVTSWDLCWDRYREHVEHVRSWMCVEIVGWGGVGWGVGWVGWGGWGGVGVFVFDLCLWAL